jgi:L-aspartate oxidase
MNHTIQQSDVIVIGAGIAGLTAALGLASLRVTLITKSDLGEGGSSVWAQGGVAVAMGADDSPDLHAIDTITASAGLADPEAVALLTREGPTQIKRLLALGARFDRDTQGELCLGREAAHSRRRILHANGDSTGAEMVRALTAWVRQTPAINVVERAFAADLILNQGHVVGVLTRHADGSLVAHEAQAVVLASGGIGRVFSRTTNPIENTGDGLAMAARAGAKLRDVEFVQFHPTALAGSLDPMPLLTEALRGEGAVLVNDFGERFMLKEHPDAELAPRDVVARAIWKRQTEGETVFLDARAVIGDRFPRVTQLCHEAGFDPKTQMIPVSPAVHYHMGGVAVDADGRTSLPGLWACGEVSATGVHGANRLASNSLLEALVYGARAPMSVLQTLESSPKYGIAQNWTPSVSVCEHPRQNDAPRAALMQRIRELMWSHVGLVRDAERLQEAKSLLAEFDRTMPATRCEARNILDCARLITSSSLERRESRGGHYRSDYPSPDPAWEHHIELWGLSPTVTPELTAAILSPAPAFATL